MINWDAIGAIAELVGALAVVVTLVYLAIQIRQNASSVRAASYQAWAAAKSAPVVTAQQSDVARSISGMSDPTSITEVELIQLAHWFHSLLHVGETTHYLHKEGIIGDDVYEKELQRSVATVVSPAGQQWWDAGARTQFTPEFVETIEARKNKPSPYNLFEFTEGRGFH